MEKKEQLLRQLRSSLSPGEVVTVEGHTVPPSLTDTELLRIYKVWKDGPKESIREVVLADRHHEMERMRLSGWDEELVKKIAQFLNVDD